MSNLEHHNMQALPLQTPGKEHISGGPSMRFFVMHDALRKNIQSANEACYFVLHFHFCFARTRLKIHDHFTAQDKLPDIWRLTAPVKSCKVEFEAVQ
jgi:hypothetical protein